MSPSRRGHSTTTGPKIRYPTREKAEWAVAARLADRVDHTGKPWTPMHVYQCRRCAGWHFTTTAFRRSPNYMSGGWARLSLVDTLEQGDRVSVAIRLENERHRVAGLTALRRYLQRGWR